MDISNCEWDTRRVVQPLRAMPEICWLHHRETDHIEMIVCYGRKGPERNGHDDDEDDDDDVRMRAKERRPQGTTIKLYSSCHAETTTKTYSLAKYLTLH